MWEWTPFNGHRLFHCPPYTYWFVRAPVSALPLLISDQFFHRSAYSSFLKMEATPSTETAVNIYQTTWHQIQEATILSLKFFGWNSIRLHVSYFLPWRKVRNSTPESVHKFPTAASPSVSQLHSNQSKARKEALGSGRERSSQRQLFPARWYASFDIAFSIHRIPQLCMI
jgi:hypothetical protein